MTASMMHKVATKVQVGTAACAIAVAAAVAPLPAAHADPAAPIPQAALGGSAGGGSAELKSSDCEPAESPDCASSLAASDASVATLNAGLQTILQNRFWWFGTPNPNPPPRTTVIEFFPLTLVPGFLRPLFGWFENINFEACILGLTLRIGPYGTVSGSYGRGCA
jgi:hypothetical protein